MWLHRHLYEVVLCPILDLKSCKSGLRDPVSIAESHDLSKRAKKFS